MFIEADAAIPKARYNALDEVARTPAERLRSRQVEGRPALNQIEALLQQHFHRSGTIVRLQVGWNYDIV